MELFGFGEPPEIDEQALDARADELLIALRRESMQRVVDEIQRALRPGEANPAASPLHDNG